MNILAKTNYLRAKSNIYDDETDKHVGYIAKSGCLAGSLKF